MNLFELNQNYKKLEEMDDLDPQLLADTLESITDTRDIKLDNIATWIEKNKAQLDWLDSKLKDLRAKQSSLKNKNKYLMSYMTDVLDDANIKELQTQNHILKTRNYKASAIVDNLNDLPAQFKTEKTEVVANKTAIYQALKAGQAVPGARLEPNRGTVIK